MTESIPSGALKVAEPMACPFCNGACAVSSGYSSSELPWSDDGGAFHRVYCVKCQSRQLFHRTKAQAIEAWNRRASPAPQATGALSEEVRQAGALMANTMFNLAQKPGYVLTEADCKLFKSMQVKWDAALFSAKREAEPLTEERINLLCRQELAEDDGRDYYAYSDDLHWWGGEALILAFARAIEAATLAAHGIVAPTLQAAPEA